MSAQGGVCQGGCLPAKGGVCLPGGVFTCQEGCLEDTPLWTEFLTHACENITFPQLRLRMVMNENISLYVPFTRELRKRQKFDATNRSHSNKWSRSP